MSALTRPHAAPARPTRAVVVGASIAGLLAARVLADHVDQVLVLEREKLRDDLAPRGHVPQGKHAHVLLTAGQQLIEQWFPGMGEELLDQGAVAINGERAIFFHDGGYRVRGQWGDIEPICMTRPLLETTVRRHVTGRTRIRIVDGELVDGLAFDGDRVAGVRLADRVEMADLVVDCSGRNSRIAHQLTQSGRLTLPVSQVQVDVSYATRMFRRGPGDIDGSFCFVPATPPRWSRYAVLLPIEGDRWILSLGGMHGDVPPSDDVGYLAFARSLPSPVIGQVVAHCEPLTPVTSYRLPSNQRRHYERVAGVPGFVALGDTVASFNPSYGQGMSSAALQAEALGESLRRHPIGSAAMVRDFARHAARVVDMPWTVAVGADFLHPATTGPKPPGTDLINRYVHQVLLAAHTSLPVQRTMMDVQSLLAPPTSLMRPSVMARTMVAARRSPARTGRVNHPRDMHSTPVEAS